MKITTVLFLIAICIMSIGFMGCPPATDDGGGSSAAPSAAPTDVPTPAPTYAPAVPFTIDFEGAAPTFDKLVPSWNSGAVITSTIVANPSVLAPNTSANVWQATMASAYNQLPALSLAFPTGMHLANYSTIQFQVLRPGPYNSGVLDNAYKTWNVAAISSTSLPHDVDWAHLSNIYVGTGVYLADYNNTVWDNVTINIDPTYAATLDTADTIYLGIGIASEATTYYIDNITFN
jgi:hypothetical protein